MSEQVQERERDYDQRQYQRMLEVIPPYESGARDLGSMIADLEALLTCLQKPDPVWARSLRSEWGTIEDTYALALDEREGTLDAVGQKLIEEALGALKLLITTKLSRSE